MALILDWKGKKENAAAALCLAWNHHLNPKGWLDRWQAAHSLLARLKRELGPQAYQAPCRQSERLNLQCVGAQFFERRRDLEGIQPLRANPCLG